MTPLEYGLIALLLSLCWSFGHVPAIHCLWSEISVSYSQHKCTWTPRISGTIPIKSNLMLFLSTRVEDVPQWECHSRTVCLQGPWRSLGEEILTQNFNVYSISRWCIMGNLTCFRFLKAVSPLIQEASSVLTNRRGAGRLLNSVWHVWAPSSLPWQLNNHSHLGSPSLSNPHEGQSDQRPTSGPNDSERAHLCP